MHTESCTNASPLGKTISVLAGHYVEECAYGEVSGIIGLEMWQKAKEGKPCFCKSALPGEACGLQDSVGKVRGPEKEGAVECQR